MNERDKWIAVGLVAAGVVVSAVLVFPDVFFPGLTPKEVLGGVLLSLMAVAALGYDRVMQA